MKLDKRRARFKSNENGAAAVDLISLTASALGLGLAVLTVVVMVIDDNGEKIGHIMSSEEGRTIY